MAEWSVQLEGHQFDLLDLAEHVCSPDISVSQEGDAFLLRSDFEQCGVAARVIDAGPRLNAVDS